MWLLDGREVEMTYELIDTDVLRVDDFNREVNQARARVIARDWNPLLLQAITVVRTRGVKREKDGDYLIDGQHRVAAAGIAVIPKVWAQIFTGALTYKDRARMYYELQQSRRSLSAIEAFVGLIAAEDKEAVAVEKILAKHGLVVSKALADNSIQAIAATRAAYRMSNPPGKALDQVLMLVVREWKGEPKAFDGDLLKGLTRTLARATKKVDLVRLAGIMKSTVPGALIAKAQYERGPGSRGGEGTALAIQATVTRAYNKGLLPSERLTEKRPRPFA